VTETVSGLAAARDATARHAWAEAFELLAAAESEGESVAPEDLEALGDAAWWTARLDACIGARERAYAAYIESGNRRRAAFVAMTLVKDYFAKRATSIGMAWVNRAERLLADEPECVETGYLERLRSVLALEGEGDYEKALEHAQRTHEVALRTGDRNLEALGLHDQGRALVMRGDVARGMALIDEATAPAVAGELDPYNTGVIYCNTITACKELADYRRAGDWTEAAKRWCDRQAIAGFPGMCRVYRASVLLTKGAWADAEEEARRACEELKEFNLSYAAEAFYELGEIRFRSGDVAAADAAFRQAHGLGRDPQPGLALLHLAEGRTDRALRCLEQALEDEAADLHRARLLPALAEVAVATGDDDQARAAAEELGAIAERFGSDALEAAASTARARVALAGADVRAAVREARAAIRLWQAVDAPYEAAEARMVLGAAYGAAGEDDAAALELEAAVSAFERLGAPRDARAAREQLAALVPPSAGNGARATRTFMFTDIVRSTNLVEAIGDEAWANLVRWHDGILRSLFEAHGGEEVDHAGDGFFVAFGEPASAVACAVAIQRRLAEHRREHGFAPQVRVGVHAADASRHGVAYKGRGVHAAARIAGLADGGEILASAATSAAVPATTASEPRSVELKGFAEPVDVVAIDWR
jgi:class 3 adenylate cyclase